MVKLKIAPTKQSILKNYRDRVLLKYGPVRRRLPDERKSITRRFVIAGTKGYLTVGMFPDGSPGEVFIEIAKEGSTISGLFDTIATLISYSLQYGIPLSVLSEKFKHTRFEPAGVTNDPEIPMAHSIVDYIFKRLDMMFETGGGE